jgi:hypothetical protein
VVSCGGLAALETSTPKIDPRYRRLIRRGGVLVVEGRMRREGGVVNVVMKG